jgi:hypothetical protein
MELPVLRNVALVFGLLATLPIVAYARLVGVPKAKEDSP